MTIRPIATTTKRKKVNDSELSNAELWLDKGIDIENRRVMLDEEIDAGIIGMIIRGIYLMELRSKELPITVIINTPGGDCSQGLALYDILRATPCEIHTIGMGEVMSMGTWLMLAGDRRFAYKNTTFMWHSIASDPGNEKLFSLKTEVKEVERLYEKLLEIYEERTTEDKTFWRSWLQYEDRYGDAEKAIELGFVEEVIPYATT